MTIDEKVRETKSGNWGKRLITASALVLGLGLGYARPALAQAPPNFPPPENVVSINNVVPGTNCVLDTDCPLGETCENGKCSNPNVEEGGPELSADKRILYWHAFGGPFGQYTILQAIDDGSGGFTNIRAVVGINNGDHQRTPSVTGDGKEILFSRHINLEQGTNFYNAKRINDGSPFDGGTFLDLNMVSVKETSPSFFGIDTEEDLRLAFVRICDPAWGCDPAVNSVYETSRPDRVGSPFDTPQKKPEFDAILKPGGRITAVDISPNGLIVAASCMDCLDDLSGTFPSGGEDIIWGWRDNITDGGGNFLPFGNFVYLESVNGPNNDRDPSLVTQGNDVVGIYFSSDRPGGLGNYDIWRTNFACSGQLPQELSGPASPHPLLVYKIPGNPDTIDLSFENPESNGDSCGTLPNINFGALDGRVRRFYNHAGRICHTTDAIPDPGDPTRMLLTVVPPEGSVYILLTASTAAGEGSLGMNSDGIPREDISNVNHVCGGLP